MYQSDRVYINKKIFKISLWVSVKSAKIKIFLNTCFFGKTGITIEINVAKQGVEVIPVKIKNWYH